MSFSNRLVCQNILRFYKVSKYFINNQTSMDDSLSDFQEVSGTCKGPKQTKSMAPISRSKTRKKTTKIRGQKDIRTVLSSKKNELLSYTEDFNKVCKISGIDVDSEQLQLAVALSRSLQHSNNDNICSSNDSQNPHTMTSQERCGKIRTTLEEYGFKVPEIKIIIPNKKKLRGRRKNSKLLQMSNEERHQLITDKFSEIMFNTFDETNSIKQNNLENVSNCFRRLYDLCTNEQYEILRNDSVFYVNNLIEASSTKIGSLLKDWNEIPGRPFSPCLVETTTYNFLDVTYSQDELDIILSGKFDLIKSIIKNKQLSDIGILQKPVVHSMELEMKSKSDILHEIETNPCKSSVINTKFDGRSTSPDFFADDMSSIMDNSSKMPTVNHKDIETELNEISSQPNSQSSASNYTRKRSNDFMDLTECVNINSLSHNYIETKSPERKNLQYLPISEIDTNQMSNYCNFTKRKSNDFMDLTECIKEKIVQTLSPVQENDNLTQHSNDSIQEDIIEKEIIDLTQTSNSNETLPDVYMGIKKDDPENTIIYTEHDTTQLFKTNITLRNGENDYINKREINNIANSSILEENLGKLAHTQNNTSFFDDYVYQHSDECSTKNSEHVSGNSSNFKEDLDLTQLSSSSEENEEIKYLEINDTITTEKKSFSKLGKCDDVSIDYDEVCQNIHGVSAFSSKESIADLDLVNTFNLGNNDKVADNMNEKSSSIISDQCLDVFEISDEELNYSMQKFKCLKENNNFRFEGISLLDNVSSVQNFRSLVEDKKLCDNSNTSASDSFLPTVEIKGIKTNSPMKTFDLITPVKKFINETISKVKTPTNSEYIVKTTHVTPIVDYEVLSTPERNKELEKFGLRPLKRKRAIQILQHLYNQTHPVIENYMATPSTSKRFKSNEPCTNDANSKVKSPRKLTQEFTENEKNILSDKENIYHITNELPVIREVESNLDDWVFQKKEKAKIHTCRVPLHIVFHNYVSCRRGLKEAILRYEPISIDVIHKDLINYGFRFDPKDILKFMDKHCITVKTMDNNTRNTRKVSRNSD